MGVVINGVELSGHTHNGIEVQRWVHDGVEVYSGFTPFYWVENGVVTSGYPTDYTVTITQGVGYSTEGTKVTGFGVWSPGQDIASKAYGYTPLVDTKGAKYMIIDVTTGGGGSLDQMGVNGNVIPDSNIREKGSGTFVVDISQYEEVQINTWITSWPWGNHFNVNITRIYFTNEI